MPEFDIDQFKKSWQEQDVRPKYNSTDIESMLNKSSRNYVKYISWISFAEFLIILGLNLYNFFAGDESQNFINILQKFGVQNSLDLQTNFDHLYLGLKIISLSVTAFFVYCFYANYKKINVESNLKKLIVQIIKFKKTVNLFMLANIFLMVFYSLTLIAFSNWVLIHQKISLNIATLIGFYVGFILLIGVSLLLIWIYYKIVYGIILKRLEINLAELKKIDTENS
jgi:hypothetical protein